MRDFTIVMLVMLTLVSAPPAESAEEIGIFEVVLESSLSFEETAAALESAINDSALELHAIHSVRVPDDLHQARVFVVTSPGYVTAAVGERARTISAQILRIAVYTTGGEQTTFINMANPVAHAMVYYSGSNEYEALVAAASDAADEIRQVVSAVPGTTLSRQLEPMRSEKHYRKYKGDGPARMMAKFRTWEKSQLEILTDSADNFESVADSVVAQLREGQIAEASETDGWEIVSTIRLRDDVVHIGLTNPFIEDKMVSINSRFRKDGKSEGSPYPGVDHVSALPTEVLVVKEGDETLVLHYGQMWRMQLYFWDSGYRAFTANMGTPGKIVRSIESAIVADD